MLCMLYMYSMLWRLDVIRCIILIIIMIIVLLLLLTIIIIIIIITIIVILITIVIIIIRCDYSRARGARPILRANPADAQEMLLHNDNVIVYIM